MEDLRDPTGIFAERYVYHYVDDADKENGRACFEGDLEMIRMYIDRGADYIVQTKRFSPMFSCPVDVGERVFENDEVVVYKLF